ncbi:hypothetical protein M0R45_011071 [Rubus argutus]|uniref:Uncharacterized protein n=1 Tax=Rubus argutus TaxID=59490 RepID=A0AAW1Y8X7_RUBAR
MDSQNLKQRRVADEPSPDTNTSATTMNKNNYRSKRDMAKRGLRSSRGDLAPRCSPPPYSLLGIYRQLPYLVQAILVPACGPCV